MSVTPRKRMLAGFALANVLILAVAGLLVWNRPAAPPIIQGVLLPEGRALPPFSLLDHRGETFSNGDLEGRWHLVSYGFTSCPDICPTTLALLASAADALSVSTPGGLRVLFYSVDHRRDTVAQMASYVPYFHPDFVGLTHRDDPANRHLPFEQGLGISARLVPEDGADSASEALDYEVLHGVNLLLLNPRGQLQAIFKPRETAPGVWAFDRDTLVADYLAVRHYLEG